MAGVHTLSGQPIGEAHQVSSDDEQQQQLRHQEAVPQQNRHGRLRPKHLLAKLHQARKWFDSGEYWAAKQGIKLQDVLPGGAPVDALPAKLEPSPVPGPRSRSHLQAAAGFVEASPQHVTPHLNTVDV